MTFTFAIASALGEALALMTGCWEGTLEYRDYQSNQIAEIPVESCYATANDFTYTTNDSAFTDPGFLVYTHAVRQPLNDDEQVRDVFFRGGEMDVREKSVEMFVVTVDGFSLELVESGLDNEEPAQIREVIRLYGDDYLAEKYVTPDGQTEAKFRNRIRLSRKQETDAATAE